MTTLTALGLTAAQGRDATITSLAVDSRDVIKGSLFAALPGAKVHGAEFIQYALRMGAAALLTDAAGARIAADVLAASDAALIFDHGDLGFAASGRRDRQKAKDRAHGRDVPRTAIWHGAEGCQGAEGRHRGLRADRAGR